MDADLDRRIDRLRKACGCRAGMAALLAASGAYGLYAAFWDSAVLGLRHRVFAALGLGLAAAVAGKLVGLLWAQLQLRRLLRQQAPRTLRGS